MNNLKKILQEFKVHKSKWVLTKFGEVAIQQKENIDRENTNLSKYVKGDHMNTQDLHLRSWGELTDEYLGPAFIRKFEKENILYGSRRTYLRKVVIAPFSGITSNTTFVIKANERSIDKNLLPFVMMSENFTENSIKNSKGSVNPYINWKDIAKYKFLLPSKDEQKRLSKLLWSIEDVIEKHNLVLQKLMILDSVKLKYFFYDYKTSKYNQLKDIISITKGKKPPILSKDRNGLPYCTLKYFRTGIPDDIVPIKKLGKSVLIEDNDLLIVWDGASGEIILGKKGVLASTMCKIEIKNTNYIKDYLYQLLRSKENYLKNTTIGSAIPHIDPMVFESIKVPRLTISQQTSISIEFKAIQQSIENVKDTIIKSKELRNNLINQIF